MPSGEGAVEATQAAGGVGGAVAQTDQLGGAVAVRQAGAAAPRQALGRARAGAEAANSGPRFPPLRLVGHLPPESVAFVLQAAGVRQPLTTSDIR